MLKLRSLIVFGLVAFAGHSAWGQMLYINDFEDSGDPLSEWSDTNKDTTPTGRSFLGEFLNESVVLSLADLPVHTELLVSFDFFMLNTWDGMPPGAPGCSDNSGNPGELWRCEVISGPVLVNDSFAHAPTQCQSYPDGGTNPPYTGAEEMRTLDADERWLQGNAVYRISKRFAHTATSIDLSFSATGLQTGLDSNGDCDECWGLDNITVSIPPEIPTVSAWGLIVMVLALVAGGTFVMRQRRVVV